MRTKLKIGVVLTLCMTLGVGIFWAGAAFLHGRGDANVAEQAMKASHNPQQPLIERAVTAKLEPAPATQVAEIPGDKGTGNADAGEPIWDVIPGTTKIPMSTGAELLVAPADPYKPRADQTEWRYVPLFRVVDVKYDAAKRLLLGHIDARLSAQTNKRVDAELRKKTGAPEHVSFVLNPVRIQSLTLELDSRHKTMVIKEYRSGHDIATGLVPFSYHVVDDDVHDALANHLGFASLLVRTTSPYVAFNRSFLQVDHVVSAIRDSLEKVLPRGMSIDDLEKRPLVVDRESAFQLQQALREQFRIRAEGNQARLAAFEKVVERLLSRLTVSEVPLHEVTRDIIDQCLVWNSATMKLDVSPNERTTMTKELEEANEKRSAFKQVWESMREESKKAQDHKSWHKTLYDKLKKEGNLSVGISIFSASLSLKMEQEHNESDQGADQKLREAFEKMRSAGEMTQETFEKSYRKFKGEDYSKSVAGKILNLNRLTKLNTLSVRSALIEHVERISKGQYEKLTILALEDGIAPQADLLQQIVELEQLINKQVKSVRAELEQRRIEELGTMKPWFSTKLPKGWVWADGKEKFPHADWVPKGLKGVAVPDMKQHLIGGAKDESGVGKTFRAGSIGGQKLTPSVTLSSTPGFAPPYPQFPTQDVYGMIGVEGEAAIRLMDFVGARRTFTKIPQPTYSLSVQESTLPRTNLDSADTNPRHVMCHWIIFIGVE
jgi:hypothetical protein